MSRHISEKFLNEFLSGSLKKVLEFVKADNTLDMELRGNSVMLYYRGALLLTINESGSYDIINDGFITLDSTIKEVNPINEPKKYIPEAKRLIDKHMESDKKCKHRDNTDEESGKNPWEREIEQLIVRENNYSSNAPDTDFYCLDMEYDEPGEDYGREDIVALQWNSDSNAHKQDIPKVKIYLIEVKQGINTIRTKGRNPGLKKHYENFKKLRDDKDKSQDFIKDMLCIFKQKYQLGLISMTKTLNDKIKAGRLKGFDASPTLEMAFILANYKHRSTVLSNELKEFNPSDLPNLKFFQSCFMGYGLYSDYMLSGEEALEYCNL